MRTQERVTSRVSPGKPALNGNRAGHGQETIAAPDNCPSKPATCFSSFGDMVIFSQLDIHEPFSPASNFQSETSHHNRSFSLQHLFCFVSI